MIAVIVILAIAVGGTVYVTKKKNSSISENQTNDISGMYPSVIDSSPETNQNQSSNNSSTNVSTTSQPQVTQTQTNTTTPTQVSTSATTTNVSNDNSSTNTQEQGGDEDVIDQPAYLISAYTQNGKNYIDVDYIQVLSGSASLQAQVEDGECSNINDCYDFPNGYKRNQNSLIRTFEVVNNAPITIYGLLFSKKVDIAYANANNGSGYYTSGDWYNDYSGNQNNHSVTFTEFKNLISQVTSYLIVNPPFQQPKTYIRIDVQNDKVIKITEPYQE